MLKVELSTKEIRINQQRRTPVGEQPAYMSNTTSTRWPQIRRNLGKQTPFSGTYYRLIPSLPQTLSSTATQIPHNAVSSHGMPSNFHLNFIPGSLVEIHFGLGKTTKLPSFLGPKKNEVGENEKKIEKEKEKRVGLKEEKGLPVSHSLVSQGPNFPPPPLHVKKMEILILISFLLSVPNK